MDFLSARLFLFAFIHYLSSHRKARFCWLSMVGRCKYASYCLEACFFVFGCFVNERDIQVLSMTMCAEDNAVWTPNVFNKESYFDTYCPLFNLCLVFGQTEFWAGGWNFCSLLSVSGSFVLIRYEETQSKLNKMSLGRFWLSMRSLCIHFGTLRYAWYAATTHSYTPSAMEVEDNSAITLLIFFFFASVIAKGVANNYLAPKGHQIHLSC